MGKHFIEKNSKNTKWKKIIFFIILLMLIITILVYLFNVNNPKSEPKKLINNVFNSLKNGEVEEINNYIDYNYLISILSKKILNNENENQISNIEKELFKELEWKIEKVEIEGERATVVVEVTNKDFKEIMTTWMKDIVNNKNSQDEIVSTNLAMESFENTIKNTKNKKSIIKKIKLNKINEKWVIINDDEFRYLVFPGIESVITVLEEFYY